MKKITLSILLLLLSTKIIFCQWQVKLSGFVDVGNPVNYPLFAWFPDGHIAVLQDNDEYIMFWAEFESHRSIGTSPFVEDQNSLVPETAVFGSRGNYNSYNNGGSWMMSVFRQKDDDFIGFFHAEDHWYPHTNNDIAWKSIGVAYSEDKGQTWTEGNQIITSATPKPASPEWGGTGDCCVVWDHFNNRWMCYFQEQKISMAVSTDPNGAPGSWKKYYLGEFSEDGLGGMQSVLPGLEQYAGGNPSVHWNTYLGKWVMVWHGWDPPVIYIAVSDDGISWENPQSIIVSDIGGRAWYPTIIGSSDVEAGQMAIIYYADIASNFSYRKFKARTISFFDSNNTNVTSAQIDSPISGGTISTSQIEIKASIDNIKSPIEKVEFYEGDNLIGSDMTFPFKYKWHPSQKGSYSIKAIFTDVDGNKFETSKVLINYDFVLGANDNYIRKSDFLIYPSPGSDNIILTGLPTGPKKVSIYDSNQRKLYDGKSESSEFVIDIKDFATGFYFINVLCEKQILKKKFLKK